MRKEIVKSLLRDFHTIPLPAFTPRELSIPLGTGKIVTLIGSRRSGKTYMLYQLTAQLIEQGVAREQIFFINFEDERLDLEAKELDLLLQAYQELYPELNLAECYFLFDEIQVIHEWERFVRRLHERVCQNLFITGSNARLLSSEIATALRGRSISRTVYPFSFSELLRHRKIEPDLHATKNRGLIESALDQYLVQGGFPEVVAMDDPLLQREILQSYFEVMLLRDLADRYHFTNITALRYFMKRLAASATKQISIHAIYNALKSAGVRIGKNALYDFLRGAEDIFFAKSLPQYSAKASTRELGEKKIYIIDNGLLDAIRFRFSDDKGKAMEQLVYWQLQRAYRPDELYYSKNGYECDFIVACDQQRAAYQVCYSLEDPATRVREIKGLLRGCQVLGVGQGTIITRYESEQMELEGVTIQVRSLASFLLG